MNSYSINIKEKQLNILGKNKLKLFEYIEKRDGNFFVVSHKTGKTIGKKVGYKSKNKAIRALLGMKSKGGFYNLSRWQQFKRIRSYKKKHRV